jgi:hypothetical protein
MNFQDKLQNLCERFVAWSIRRCVAQYSAVITRELVRIDTEHASFKLAAQTVAADHHKRLQKLEETR